MQIMPNHTQIIFLYIYIYGLVWFGLVDDLPTAQPAPWEPARRRPPAS
jgi:hypothetical protein